MSSISGTIPSSSPPTGRRKAGIISLTRSLNEELDADGVRAIAICPGFVDTPMAEWKAWRSRR